jgi:hypothetical protein
MRNCKNGHLHCRARGFYVLIRGITCHFSEQCDRRVMVHSMLWVKNRGTFFLSERRKRGKPCIRVDGEVIHAFFLPPSYYIPPEWAHCVVYSSIMDDD